VTAPFTVTSISNSTFTTFSLLGLAEVAGHECPTLGFGGRLSMVKFNVIRGNVKVPD
jgi:hypothetical protein